LVFSQEFQAEDRPASASELTEYMAIHGFELTQSMSANTTRGMVFYNPKTGQVASDLGPNNAYMSSEGIVVIDGEIDQREAPPQDEDEAAATEQAEG